MCSAAISTLKETLRLRPRDKPASVGIESQRRREMKKQLLFVALVCGVVGAVGARHVLAQGPTKVELKDAKGESVGTATITAAKTGGGVSIALDLKNLPTG